MTSENGMPATRVHDIVRRPCVACPFRDGENEEATTGQNYGCLPSSFDMVEIFDSSGVAMSCHDNDKKACRGLAAVRNVTNAKVKAYSDWYHNG
jgi:hypothetical protein